MTRPAALSMIEEWSENTASGYWMDEELEYLPDELPADFDLSAYDHHRPAERRALFHELLGLDVRRVHLVGLEPVNNTSASRFC